MALSSLNCVFCTIESTRPVPTSTFTAEAPKFMPAIAAGAVWDMMSCALFCRR